MTYYADGKYKVNILTDETDESSEVTGIFRDTYEDAVDVAKKLGATEYGYVVISPKGEWTYI